MNEEQYVRQLQEAVPDGHAKKIAAVIIVSSQLHRGLQVYGVPQTPESVAILTNQVFQLLDQ